LRDKRHLFKQYVDDVTLDLRTMLTADEMFGLFGLPVPNKMRSDRHPVGAAHALRLSDRANR